MDRLARTLTLVLLASALACNDEDAYVSDSFAIRGKVEGLVGSGLTLQVDSGPALEVTESGSFAFDNRLTFGSNVSVSVTQQPTDPAQTCSVSQPTTVVRRDVSDVFVRCVTNEYTVGGVVTGLRGTGLLLRNGELEDLPVREDGSFTFASKVAAGTEYDISVVSQPSSPAQLCTVTSPSGKVTGDSDAVTVECSNRELSLGGTVSGLSGSGLTLRTEQGDSLLIEADGSFAFSEKIESGAPYAVDIDEQPTSPAQTCTIGGGSGTAVSGDVRSIAVSCAPDRFTLGGSVTGLVGAGLSLRVNGGRDLELSANGGFAFAEPFESGQTFAVTVETQPSAPQQTCTVDNSAGSVAGSGIDSVAVSCALDAFPLGGVVTDMIGTGLTLQNNSGDDVTLDGSGAFNFPTHVPSGETYHVTVLQQPSAPDQTCVVSHSAGVVGNKAINNLSVRCTSL